MNETHTPRRILRSIGALFAGFVVVVVLSLGTDLALHGAGAFPAWSSGPTGIRSRSSRPRCPAPGRAADSTP